MLPTLTCYDTPLYHHLLCTHSIVQYHTKYCKIIVGCFATIHFMVILEY